MTEMKYHNPVLLSESVDGLAIQKDGIYVDVTFGGGGHSREILKRLGPHGRLVAFDQDEDALDMSTLEYLYDLKCTSASSEMHSATFFSIEHDN